MHLSGTEYKITVDTPTGKQEVWAFTMSSKIYLDPDTLANKHRRARIKYRRKTLDVLTISGTPTENNCVVFTKTPARDNWDFCEDSGLNTICKRWFNEYQEEMKLQVFLNKTFGLGKYAKQSASTVRHARKAPVRRSSRRPARDDSRSR